MIQVKVCDVFSLYKSEVKPGGWWWWLVTKLYLTLLWPPWTVAHQAPLSMGLSRHESWSGLPFRSSGHLPHPGIESASLALAGDSSPLSHQGSQIRGHYCTKQPHLKRVSVWDGFSHYTAPLLADSCVLLFPLFPIGILSFSLYCIRV